MEGNISVEEIGQKKKLWCIWGHQQENVWQQPLVVILLSRGLAWVSVGTDSRNGLESHRPAFGKLGVVVVAGGCQPTPVFVGDR